jgi:uncharacterized protein (TIGR02996 family)
MDDDKRFLQAILAAPDDYALRLVYADWLEDRSDPRGEYLRLQVSLHSAPIEGLKEINGRARMLELTALVPLAWLGAVDPPAAWDHLRRLGQKVRDPLVFPDALAIARSTMERVRKNVVLLAERLPKVGYRFQDPATAYIPPPSDMTRLITEIEAAVGPMPLSFRAFHEIVGAVNFCQSLDQLVQWPDSRRDQATDIGLLGEEDPLYVLPLAELHRDLMEQRRRNGQRGRYAYHRWREGGEWYCFFAADEFHKANYSGGENYNLFLPDLGADFRIRDLFTGTADNEEEDREWFVNYLRKVCHGGGFRGKWTEDRGKQPPASELIQELKVGLLEI